MKSVVAWVFRTWRAVLWCDLLTMLTGKRPEWSADHVRDTESSRPKPGRVFRGEQRSEVRHEYVTGQVYAMVGASRAHNTISLNLAKALVRIYATVRTRLLGPS